MIAVDTNVLLRIVLDDDAIQVKAIRGLLTRDELFVSIGVLLETGWVLQSRYRMPRGDVAAALTLLTTLDRIVVSRVAQVKWAIERYSQGADLADMMHIVSAAKVGGFATFDRRLARATGEGAPVAIETLA